MNILNILLSGEVLLGLAAACSLAIIVRALTGFLGEATELRVRLQSVQEMLDKCREILPGKKTQLEAFRAQVQPLKPQEQKMRAHYAKLRDIERQAAKEEAEQEQEQGPPDDKIQIHRPGIPGL